MSEPDRSGSLQFEHHDAHSESSVVREKVSVLTWDTHAVPSNADSGCREPPPATVWNCDLHDRFV
jgi:hypothetical protein